MTNAELQALLKQYPDDAQIYVPFDREGDNFQHTEGVISKAELKEKFTFCSFCDLEEDDALVIC